MQLKFREGTSEASREKVIKQVRGKSRARVAPLFPDESNPALASLYTIDGIAESHAKDLAKEIEADPDVEFIEPGAERKLID
jgi:hypothetical protein